MMRPEERQAFGSGGAGGRNENHATTLDYYAAHGHHSYRTDDDMAGPMSSIEPLSQSPSPQKNAAFTHY